MRKLNSLIVKDFLLFVIIFTNITIYANWILISGDDSLAVLIPPFSSKYYRMQQLHLGGEYLNVAIAVSKGLGFSDPFGVPTGLTGWVSPILVYLMATILYLSKGYIELLAAVFFGMQIIILAFTATTVSHIGRRLKNHWASLLAIAIVISVNFKWFFQLTHDSVFQVFWVNITVIGLSYWVSSPLSTRKIIAWGTIGGLSALAGPIAGFTWAVSTTIRWGINQWKSILLAALTSIVIVAPWITYQSLRLGKFTPIKSNAFFELYQSQLVLPHGLISEKFFVLHPYYPESVEGIRYRRVGEVQYLKEKKAQALQSIAEEPLQYLKKTSNRLLAATVWLDSATNSDKQKMSFMLFRFFAIFPFLGLLALLYATPKYKPWLLPTVIACFAYLTPYIFISYYERYGVAVTLPRILLTMWFLIFVKEKCVSKKLESIISTKRV